MSSKRGTIPGKLLCAVPQKGASSVTEAMPRDGPVCDRGHSRITVAAEDIHVLVFLQSKSWCVIYFSRCLTKTACSNCFGLVNSVSSPLHCSSILL